MPTGLLNNPDKYVVQRTMPRGSAHQDGMDLFVTFLQFQLTHFLDPSAMPSASPLINVNVPPTSEDALCLRFGKTFDSDKIESVVGSTNWRLKEMNFKVSNLRHMRVSAKKLVRNQCDHIWLNFATFAQ